MMAKLDGGRMVNRRKRDELLSAYIDGEMRAAERARLEEQLASDPTLRAELGALRNAVALVRELPSVAAPRNFILPQTVVQRRRTSVVIRPRWARVAPLLTAATTVVSLLFVIALAGNLLASSTGRSMVAPARELEALGAPAAVGEDAALEAEVEVEVEIAVTVEVEAPAAAEPVEEKAAAPAEEVVAEEAPTWSPTEAVGEPAGEAREEPEPAAPEPEADDEGASRSEASRDAEVEETGDSATPIFGTLSAEKAAGMGGAETPSPAAGGWEALTSTARLATQTAEPTASVAPQADEAPVAAELEQPLAAVEAEPTVSATVQTDEAVAEESEQPLAASGAEPASGEGYGLPSSTPEQENLVALPETERPELRGGQPLAAVFPWRAVQIALGSASVLLLVITVWAWRMRR